MDEIIIKLYLVREKNNEAWYLFTDESKAKAALEYHEGISSSSGYASSLCGDAEEALGLDKFRKHTRYAVMEAKMSELPNMQCPTCSKISDA